jgi:UDP-N-acetylmuramyl pentapeptide phosphotransferase/UDP-N-acetylglucosamine-1-phosphate transferase
MDGTLVLAVVCAGVVAGVAPVLLRPMLRDLGVVDIPDARCSHDEPTIRGFGLAQLAGLAVGIGAIMLAYAGRETGAGYGVDDRWPLFVIGCAASAASVLGFFDDVRGRRGLNTGVRLVAQVIIGCAVGASCLLLDGGAWWIILFSGIMVCGYINVTNFMDGVNGISGLHGLVVGLCFAGVGALTNTQWLVSVGCFIAVVFVVFLPWNFRRPGAFLGDSGSYLLGAGIMSAVVVAVSAGLPIVPLLAPLAIYLSDSIVTMVRRMMRKEAFWKAHRSHVYQQLTDIGLGHLSVAMIVTGFTVVTGVVGLVSLVGWLPWWGAVVGVLVVCVVYLNLPSLLSRQGAGAKIGV